MSRLQTTALVKVDHETLSAMYTFFLTKNMQDPEVSSNSPFRLESPEINILILGETGVGKSTWINAFQNYITYKSFEEAENSQLLITIPTCFTLSDENWQTVTIKCGVDQNENFETGQSSTQEARIHKFRMGHTTIRLIDTPGVGDVRGVEQDQLNIKNILDTIGHLKALHGICILLKANNEKLTLSLRFCVKELLTNLQRGAINNIVFCFTSSKGFQYGPADAMKVLHVLLQEIKDISFNLDRNVLYSFDNEAVRYLAAIKNTPPFEFSTRIREDFKRSWNHSARETERMLMHFQGLLPHLVKDTISLHNARNVVLKLTKPIADVTRKIEMNKLEAEEERERIKNSKANLRELASHVKVKRSQIKSMKLDFPKLACFHMACRKKEGKEIQTQTQRYGICHERYVVKGVRADVIGGSQRRRRSEWENWPGFTADGICGYCGHKFVHHTNKFYDANEFEDIQDDQEIKRALEKNSDDVDEAKKEMVQVKTIRLEEFENELRQICDASVRFAHFTRVNSITPYNDGMEDYLELSIREEQATSGVGSKSYKLLVDRLEQYRRDKERLRMEMEKEEGNASRPLTPEEIQTTVENLKGLKHSGEDLKEALKCIIETEKKVDESVTIDSCEQELAALQTNNMTNSTSESSTLEAEPDHELPNDKNETDEHKVPFEDSNLNQEPQSQPQLDHIPIGNGEGEPNSSSNRETQPVPSGQNESTTSSSHQKKGSLVSNRISFFNRR